MIKRTLLLSALMLSVTGCPPPGPSLPPPSPTEPPKMSATKTLGQGQVTGSSAVASAADSPNGLRVDIYQLQVPLGTISRNQQFWKRVDENAVDVPTYDLLLKNGVRVGQAPIAEWEYFKKIMADYPAVTKAASLVAAESKPIELPVRKELPSQDIFYFDAQNALHGQSFDACENILTVTFQQAARKQQTMRVALCPVVRSKTKRLEFSPLNNEMEVTYAAPQRLYDLNLRTDVSLDSFLIVAPSSEATWRTSIGNSFFMTEGDAERMENVLLIVPAAIRIDQAPMPPAPPAKK